MFQCIDPESYKEIEDGFYVEKSMNMDFSTVLSNHMFDRFEEVENKSWWYKYRGRITRFFLKKYFDKKKELLDIGAANGYSALVAQRAGFNVGVLEPGKEGCRIAKMRGISNVYCGFMDEKGILDETLDQAMLMDVVEHIKDDLDFMKLLYKKMSSGGVVMITVPALMSLWSSEDVKSGHFRRYTLSQMQTLCESVGFKVVYKNYFFGYLYFPMLIFRVFLERIGILIPATERDEKKEEKIDKMQFYERKDIVGVGLSFFQKVEKRKLKNGKKIRYGSSLIIIAEK